MSILFKHWPFLFIAAALCTASPEASRAKLYLKSQEIVECNIISSDSASVKFKMADDPNGPLYYLQLKKIYMIEYADGTRKIIKTMPQRWEQPISIRSRGYEQKEKPASSDFMSLFIFGHIFPFASDISFAMGVDANASLKWWVPPVLMNFGLAYMQIERDPYDPGYNCYYCEDYIVYTFFDTKIGLSFVPFMNQKVILTCDGGAAAPFILIDGEDDMTIGYYGGGRLFFAPGGFRIGAGFQYETVHNLRYMKLSILAGFGKKPINPVK
jgi:hypothetical protein